MKGFDATSTVDSVVACDCGDFPFQTIFYPEYLNEIAVELAQRLSKVLLGSIEKLRRLLDQLLCFLLQHKDFFLFRFGPLDEKLLSGPPDWPEKVASIRYSVFNSSISGPM
jgi:hypothetical protein